MTNFKNIEELADFEERETYMRACHARRKLWENIDDNVAAVGIDVSTWSLVLYLKDLKLGIYLSEVDGFKVCIKDASILNPPLKYQGKQFNITTK